MIGVLALQGNYGMHSKFLAHLGQENILVKTVNDLSSCKALIIPGGESTVISKMMLRYDLFDPIKKFAKKKSVFGTCAGLILMAHQSSEGIDTLNIIDVNVSRNAWGRQINSFTKDIKVTFSQTEKNFKATFIRAPKIEKTSTSVNILATINKNPIMIREGRHLATSFHPEMHGDPLIHKYFLKIVNEK